MKKQPSLRDATLVSRSACFMRKAPSEVMGLFFSTEGRKSVILNVIIGFVEFPERYILGTRCC